MGSLFAINPFFLASCHAQNNAPSSPTTLLGLPLLCPVPASSQLMYPLLTTRYWNGLRLTRCLQQCARLLDMLKFVPVSLSWSG